MRVRQRVLLVLALLCVLSGACTTSSRRASGQPNLQVGPEGRLPVVLPRCAGADANITPTAMASLVITDRAHQTTPAVTFAQCSGVTLTSNVILLNPENGNQSLEAEINFGSLRQPTLDNLPTVVEIRRSGKVEFSNHDCRTHLVNLEPYQVVVGNGDYLLGVKASGTSHCGEQASKPSQLVADIVFIIDSCLPKFGLPEKELECPAPAPATTTPTS